MEDEWFPNVAMPVAGEEDTLSTASSQEVNLDQLSDDNGSINTTLFDPDSAETVEIPIQVPPRRNIVTPTQLDVCFKSTTHPGTIKWRRVVMMFANDRERYRCWEDRIKDMVKRALERENIYRYLVCLNSAGDFARRISDGNWYIASEEEILQKTKQRFLDFRKSQGEEISTGKSHSPGSNERETNDMHQDH